MFNRIKALSITYDSKRVLIASVLAVSLVALGAYFLFSGKEVVVVQEAPSLPVVTVRSVKELSSNNTFSSVGTVAAISEARLQAEAGGRVTAVTVSIGDRVGAGQVLASIENSRERASLR